MKKEQEYPTCPKCKGFGTIETSKVVDVCPKCNGEGVLKKLTINIEIEKFNEEAFEKIDTFLRRLSRRNRMKYKIKKEGNLI